MRSLTITIDKMIELKRSIGQIFSETEYLFDCLVTFSGVDKDTRKKFYTAVGYDDMGRGKEARVAKIYTDESLETARRFVLRGSFSEKEREILFDMKQVLQRYDIISDSLFMESTKKNLA